MDEIEQVLDEAKLDDVLATSYVQPGEIQVRLTIHDAMQAQAEKSWLLLNKPFSSVLADIVLELANTSPWLNKSLSCCESINGRLLVRKV